METQISPRFAQDTHTHTRCGFWAKRQPSTMMGPKQQVFYLIRQVAPGTPPPKSVFSNTLSMLASTKQASIALSQAVSVPSYSLTWSSERSVAVGNVPFHPISFDVNGQFDCRFALLAEASVYQNNSISTQLPSVQKGKTGRAHQPPLLPPNIHSTKQQTTLALDTCPFVWSICFRWSWVENISFQDLARRNASRCCSRHVLSSFRRFRSQKGCCRAIYKTARKFHVN